MAWTFLRLQAGSTSSKRKLHFFGLMGYLVGFSVNCSHTHKPFTKLRKMILGVHRDGSDPDDVLETYTFKFTYVDGNVNTCQMVQSDKSVKKVVDICTDPKAVLKCAMQMMRGTLYLVQSLGPLPGEVQLSMKLLYYDEVTPLEYEPPGFRPTDSATYNFEGDPLNVNIGKLSTPHHSLMFDCMTDSANFEAIRKQRNTADSSYADPESHYSYIWDQIPSQEITPMPTQCDWMSEEENAEDSEDYISPSQSPISSFPDLGQKSIKSNVVVVKEEAPEPSPEMFIESEEMVINVEDTIPGPTAEMEASTSYGPQPSNCTCGGDRPVGLVVVCNVCKCWSHAACYGFIVESELPQGFVCLHCHNEGKGMLCADTKLLALEPDQRQEICVYRQVLVFCQDMHLVSAAKLSREMHIDRSTTADKMVQRLENDSIIRKSKARRSSRMVNHEMLRNSVLEQYFGPTATLGLDLKTEMENRIKVDPITNLFLEVNTELEEITMVDPTASVGLEVKPELANSTMVDLTDPLCLDLSTELDESLKKMKEMQLAPRATRTRKRYLLEQPVFPAKEKRPAKRKRSSPGEKLMVKRLR